MADLKNVDRVFDSSGNALFSGGGGNLSALFHIQDQKSDGTAGGDGSAGYNTRDLNTILSNQIVGASLTSNQFTLPAGSYFIQVSAPAYLVDLHRIKLQNITDASVALLGTSEFSRDTSGELDGATRSFLSGNISISTEKIFEIQHYLQNVVTSPGSDLGRAATSGDVEVYTDVLIWKLDGTNNAIGSSVTLTGLWEELDRQTASVSANLDFTFDPALYDQLEVVITDLVPSETTFLAMRTSTDGGSTFDDGASDYSSLIKQIGMEGTEFTVVTGNAGATLLRLTPATGSGTNQFWALTVTIADPNSSQLKMVYQQGAGRADDGNEYTSWGGGSRLDTAAINGIQFLLSAGTMTTGTFILRGRRKGGISLPVLGGPTQVRGALVTIAADLVAQDYTTPTAIPFDQEEYDTDDIHDNSTNNTRLTIPSGVTHVKLVGCVQVNTATSASYLNASIRKNGDNDYVGEAAQTIELTQNFAQVNTVSGVLEVTSGDYFELFLQNESGTVTIIDDRTWFSVEVVEGPLAPTTQPVRSALVLITADQEITSGSHVAIIWDEALNDSANMWNGGNPTRLTVPVGVTKVRIVGGAAFDSGALGENRSLRITKNGSVFAPLVQTLQDAAEAVNHILIVTSPIFTVNTGDYFELEALHNAGGSFGVVSTSNLTWFSMEIVEPAAISQDVVESVTLTGLWEEIDRQVASESSEIDFTFNPNLYEDYELTITNLLPSSDGADFWTRVSIDNGATFEEGASDYDTVFTSALANSNSNTTEGFEGHTRMEWTSGSDSVAGSEMTGVLSFSDMSINGPKSFFTRLAKVGTSGNWRHEDGAHRYKVNLTSNVNGIRILYSTGNITSGTFILRGRRKAGFTIPVLGGPSGVRGATLQLDSDFAVADASTISVDWGSANLDTDGFWSSVNPERFTIPAGVSRVRLTAGLSLSTWVNGIRFIGAFRKNGVDNSGQALGRSDFATYTSSTGDPALTITSGILKVVPGDFFDVRVHQDSDGAEVLSGGASGDAESNFFSIEVLEGPLSPVERGWRGASVKQTADQDTTISTFVILSWDVIVEDSGGIFNATTPTRLTVPPGVTRVNLRGQVQFEASATGTNRIIRILKNGALISDLAPRTGTEAAESVPHVLNIQTTPISVIAGDYFEIDIFQDAGSSFGTLGTFDQTWFSMEVIEPVGIAPETQFDGARVILTSDFTMTDNVLVTSSWDTPARDTLGFWSSGAPTRFTIPNGVSQIRLSCSLRITGTTLSDIQFQSFKNGASHPGLLLERSMLNTTSTAFNGGKSAILDVVAGDYFTLEVFAKVASGSPLLTEHDGTWFEIEVVKGAIKPTPVEVRGASLRINSDETGIVASGARDWDMAQRDTDGFWSSANPSRLTIPANSGITKVRLSANMTFTGTADIISGILLQLNGVTIDDGGFADRATNDEVDRNFSGVSPIIDVAEGDYFEMRFFIASGTWTMETQRTWFEIEVIEPAVLAIESATFRGALINLAADITGVNYTSETAIPFETTIYDTDQIWSSTNATRLTVPSGVTHVRLNFSPFLNNIVEGQWTRLDIFKNGTSAYDGTTTLRQDNSGIGQGFSLISPILEVIAGDYFEAVVLIETETTIDVESTRTTFGMEIIEPLVKTNKIRGPWLELDRQTASNSATIDMVFDPTLYDELEITITNVVGSVDASSFSILTSTDGGQNFDNSASDYSHVHTKVLNTTAETVARFGDDEHSAMRLVNGFGDQAEEEISLTVHYNDLNSSTIKKFWWNGFGRFDDGLEHVFWGGGSRLDTTVIDGIRFLATAGNLVSGEFVLYGRPTAGVDANLLPGFTGKQTLWIPSAAMTPTVSDGCATLAAVETVAGQPDQHVLAFATGADEHAQFDIAFPNSWDKGTLTFKVFWTHQGGQGGGLDGVAWGLQAISLSSGDPFATAYGTPIVVTDDQITLDDIYVTAESAVMTVGGTPVNNDLTFFRIFRDISDGADDLDIDAQLVGVQVFYTSNKLTDD